MEMRSKRVQRVERELKELLSRALIDRSGVPLPCFVSISDVEARPDLRQARIFFRLAGAKSDVQEAQRILESERAQMQKIVAEKLDTKFCPVLRFEFGIAPQFDEVDRLLESLKRPPRNMFGEEFAN